MVYLPLSNYFVRQNVDALYMNARCVEAWGNAHPQQDDFIIEPH